MKENILDVLMYLFDNFIDDDVDRIADADFVREELSEAGFDHHEVSKAVDWLESLSVDDGIKPMLTPAFRIFCPQEIQKLDIDCRNLILFLEYNTILNASSREIVIDRVMALETEDVCIEKLKWIVFMVLLSQPNEELAFARMEAMVYNPAPTYLH